MDKLITWFKKGSLDFWLLLILSAAMSYKGQAESAAIYFVGAIFIDAVKSKGKD